MSRRLAWAMKLRPGRSNAKCSSKQAHRIMRDCTSSASEDTMNWNARWELWALGSAFFAGLTALLGKMGVAGVNSNLATLIRTVVILGVAAALVAWRNEWQRPGTISTNTWVFLVLSGIATGLSWLCYYRALQLGPVSRVAPVDKLSVAFAILLGVVVLGERLTWQTLTGAGLIIAGSLVLALA
jgi:transporter family protein